MPLVPRYTWEEDAFSIALELQLPGTVLRNIDIYGRDHALAHDLVVKVNAAPYVLLLDLQETVDDASAAVKSIPASNVLRISLQKQTEGLWKQLQYQDTKQALRERRDASMERKRASETVLSQKRKERKHQEEKTTLRAQMAVDDTNRQILTDLKAEEKEREEAKGDDFFHAKDFRSATNAYGEAISATPDDNIDLITTCLSNRAACLLQLEEFEPSKTMLLVLS
ncbi:hypothetical protein BBJ29_001841 [Phytophthora kernoviae]|uniref:CS domain-containing protein n=1 Tax=Phytophthora kernoviae TaxID=325452 RepID=A0A3F2RR57_9STRA|nr:hypothetical protein BBJ29_001841 [Phytophthora kernoviae]RLN62627.1 hypothetical protein BBP00_00004649 [Phytophthora kernoviae]